MKKHVMRYFDVGKCRGCWAKILNTCWGMRMDMVGFWVIDVGKWQGLMHGENGKRGFYA
jgi:hypothetical protein